MYIDIGILLVLFFFVFFGYKKGIIAEFISFAAIIFNVVFSKKISPLIYNLLNLGAEHEGILSIVVYVVVFIVVYIILNITITFLLKTLKKNSKMALDSLVGALFGFLKGAIVIMIVMVTLVILANFNKGVEERVEDSYTYRGSLKIIEQGRFLLPDNIREILEEYNEKKEVEKILKEFLDKEK